MVVDRGNVTLDPNGLTYTTIGSSTAVRVGNEAGQTGRLTLIGGRLAVDTLSDNVTIGSVLGATGFLTVSAEGQLGSAGCDPR